MWIFRWEAQEMSKAFPSAQVTGALVDLFESHTPWITAACRSKTHLVENFVWSLVKTRSHVGNGLWHRGGHVTAEVQIVAPSGLLQTLQLSIHEPAADLMRESLKSIGKEAKGIFIFALGATRVEEDMCLEKLGITAGSKIEVTVLDSLRPCFEWAVYDSSGSNQILDKSTFRRGHSARRTDGVRTDAGLPRDTLQCGWHTCLLGCWHQELQIGGDTICTSLRSRWELLGIVVFCLPQGPILCHARSQRKTHQTTEIWWVAIIGAIILLCGQFFDLGIWPDGGEFVWTQWRDCRSKYLQTWRCLWWLRRSLGIQPSRFPTVLFMIFMLRRRMSKTDIARVKPQLG